MADAVSFDTFILLVLLILVGIVLFISLVTAIYVIRLSRKVVEPEGKPGRKFEPSTTGISPEKPVHAGEPQAVHPAQAEVPSPVTRKEERKFNLATDAPDIPTGIQNLCTLHGLDSLTVSSQDGLVIASSGHPLAVSEAARFSYAFQTGDSIHEEGVQVFPVDYHASTLVGILRSHDAVPDSNIAILQKDLTGILEKWI